MVTSQIVEGCVSIFGVEIIEMGEPSTTYGLFVPVNNDIT